MAIRVKDLAEELEIDQKTARRFLRSVVPDHEKGGRWEIDDTDLMRLKLIYMVKEVGLEDAVETLKQLRHIAPKP